MPRVNATNERRRAAASRGAPGREGNNVRGEATREVILLTAERLFAERGIEAVPLRDIGVAAGQRNHVAVQYHFGDRENLVQAIAAYRAQFLTDVSANLVADLVAGGRALTVTDFVRATVTALAANLDDESHFLPFISRYIIERGGYGGLEHTVPTGSAATLRTILQRLLPDHTEALLDERWEILFTSAVHTLARYQVMLHDRALPAPIDDLIEDLARVLAAGLETPAAASSPDRGRQGRTVRVVATP
jgi:AcrR family transcriptional regulator